jgi:uncharacterized heparinase superfamily protein
MLDAVNSSEVWGGFRVGRRASVFDVRTLETSSAFELEAAHDGYAHLAGRPIHRRRWSLSDSGLTVVDEVSGAGTHEAAIHFHFGPDVGVEAAAGGAFRIIDANDGRELAVVTIDPAADAAVIPTTWHPGFGLSRPASCLRIGRSGPAPYRHTTVFRWSSV